MAGTTPNYDALLSALVQGFERTETKRGGVGGFWLVQDGGRTLGMARVTKRGVRLEGSRLDKALTITTKAEVAQGRKALQAVADANAAKQAERDAKKAQRDAKAKAAKATKQPTGRPVGKGDDDPAVVEAIDNTKKRTGARARTRATASVKAVKVA